MRARPAVLLVSALCALTLAPVRVASQSPADGHIARALAAPDDAAAIVELEESLGLPGLDAQARAEVLTYLVEREVRIAAPDLPLHLWMLYWAGSTWDLIDYALRALDEPHRWSPPQQEEFLKLVAVGLSSRFYEPTSFVDSPVGSRLASLAENPALSVRDGVVELLHWHDPDPWGPIVRGGAPDGCSEPQLEDLRGRREGVWDWWADTTAAAEPRMTRAEAGRTLARRLGNWYGEHGPDSATVAESYLCVAAVVDTSSIMTSAFRDLVWTYVDANAGPAIQLLHNRFAYQFDNSLGSSQSGDKDYLRDIEDALDLGFHPFWKEWWFWGSVALVPYPVCRWVFQFDFCGGDGNATGTIIITVP